MTKSKRLNFLKSYLRIFGVDKIELTTISKNSISGIAFYEDETDHDDRQEFIWHKSENEVPSVELNLMIDKIVAKKWHSGDKISEHIERLEFEEFNETTREKILEELFDVRISMVDDGEETDSYWVHY